MPQCLQKFQVLSAHVQLGALLLLLLNCGSLTEPAASPGRLFGDVVFKGMSCAPNRANRIPPCSGPYVGYEVAVLSADRETTIASVTTGEKGEFSLDLPAGNYVIRLPSSTFSAYEDKLFTINAGEDSEIHLVVDTGVR